MTSGAAGVLLAALILTVGCATMATPVEVAVTDFKQVAGAWTSTGRSASRVTVVIQANGKYWMATERGAGLQGQLRVDGGVLRYEAAAGSWRGTATVLDDRGKEYLRFTHDTGQLWIECERAP